MKCRTECACFCRDVIGRETWECCIRAAVHFKPSLINVLYCRYWNIAFFYLQLIRLNVSTAVRVILPPGLQEKSDIVKVVLRKRVYYNHDSNRQSFWIWYTNKKKRIKRQSDQDVIWHCVNIEFVKYGYLNPSSTHCLSLAESCAPFIMYGGLRIALPHRAAWTSHHHWKPSSTQAWVHRACVLASSIKQDQMFEASLYSL